MKPKLKRRAKRRLREIRSNPSFWKWLDQAIDYLDRKIAQVVIAFFGGAMIGGILTIFW